MNYDILHNFISPVTGRILCEKDYILVGNNAGIANPSPALIDTKLDLIKLRHDVDEVLDTSFILKTASFKLPKAQALNELSDGFMYNTNGVISTTNDLPLPDLPLNHIWIGDINNRPVSSEYRAAPDEANYILQTPSPSLVNSQALSEAKNSLGVISHGILKTSSQNGVVSIASGGKLPANDYVRPLDLIEEINTTRAFATAEATAAELAANAYFLGEMLPFIPVPPITIGGAISAAIGAVNAKIDNLDITLEGEAYGSGKLNQPVQTKVAFSFFKRADIPLNPHLGMLLFVEK